jgi:hypothetical protein
LKLESSFTEILFLTLKKSKEGTNDEVNEVEAVACKRHDEYKQQRIAKKVGTEPFESQKRDQINCLKGF